MLIYNGRPALSEFRRRTLLAACHAESPQIRDVRASFLVVVELERELTASEHHLLERVLQVDGPAAALGASDILISPRPGTISSWSSKASDILHNCGLTAVTRIERGTTFHFSFESEDSESVLEPILPFLFDRMTEARLDSPSQLSQQVRPEPLANIPLMKQGDEALTRANKDMGLALTAEEIDYFSDAFRTMGRDPTDVELMMFSVVNSEHCRHKIFNARWVIDGRELEPTLFDMIRHTHAAHPQGCVKAYSDNAGVIEGFATPVFRPEPEDRFAYAYRERQTHIVLKVETHNHPTAISPYPGASTGVGGEIRDEGATGIGGQPQAGLCAFFTSHLRVPGFAQPWESSEVELPAQLASPLAIMTEGPIGGAAFGNEFGRPNICGIFRTFEAVVDRRYRGYHKPIMVAGGVGLIDAEHVEKKPLGAGDLVIQIGGPAMLIGLGGGAASSMDTGTNVEDLDFASVQRDNPEMERRCQELLNRCIALGTDNPILSIHDVGAGGLANACPELVADTGGAFQLRKIENADPGMSPMELWCNEAQERYVLVIGGGDRHRFAELAARERCPFAIIGEISDDGKLNLEDSQFGSRPIADLDLDVILGKPPRMVREVSHRHQHLIPLHQPDLGLEEIINHVLRFPAVASKSFLITIADRTVTGLVARDQMVGPYQVPVADVAVTTTSFKTYTGSAMAMGERTPVALIDAPASARLAIAEAITNIAGARIGPIGHIKLSANWMCACGEDGEDALLYDTVEAVGMEFCPALGIAIPVGKDSLAMRTVWQDSRGESHEMSAPLSLVISAFAPVQDVRQTLTPELCVEGDTRLLVVDLGHGRNRLGGSVYAQVLNQLGNECPEVDPAELKKLYDAVQELLAAGHLLAYHDRSDGGLLATLAEMAFAGGCGVDVDLAALGEDGAAALFAEEIGVVLQCRTGDLPAVIETFRGHGLADLTHEIGCPAASATIQIASGGEPLLFAPTRSLQQTWSELSYRMQSLRDNPDCAREEFESLLDEDAGMFFEVGFQVSQSAAPADTDRPQIAVLREQGVNGHVEMAAAFDAAGFESVDVPMTDLLSGRVALDRFQGLVACGGFSYGDVLGAGAGWARTILFNDRLRAQFETFFQNPNTFSLGVCNGCQMLSHLKELIPGAELWPSFLRNRSEQFEARYVTVEVVDSPSILLGNMVGARLGIPCAHGEGRAEFADPEALKRSEADGLIALRYVDHRGAPTQRYPFNPNGSPSGIAAISSNDGRVTIMMPHPERVFRNVQLSWQPADWSGEFSPWLQMFQNARHFLT
jgi:phosphoribosylformylglycinamidine synthase